MILTGFYLWWPRGRSLRAALWPRTGLGARILVRDLHACVGVLFSAVFLFFLVRALPWTAFWRGQALSRMQAVLGQQSLGGLLAWESRDRANGRVPAFGGSSRSNGACERGSRPPGRTARPLAGRAAVDHQQGQCAVRGPILLADAQSGATLSDFRNEHLPAIPRLVALGVHLHQGDFGPINLWLNTAFALSLVWLAATGIVSWWIRRPGKSTGILPKVRLRWPRAMIAAAVALCVQLPIFAASLALVACLERLRSNLA
jgi:uncharacterized iron-regulated membrane protein